jgi:hypothetical protein
VNAVVGKFIPNGKRSLTNMPSAQSRELPEWKRPAKTTTNLDRAEISVIDIFCFDKPGGKEKLAEDLRNAVSLHIQFKAILGFAVVTMVNRFKQRGSSA